MNIHVQKVILTIGMIIIYQLDFSLILYLIIALIYFIYIIELAILDIVYF